MAFKSSMLVPPSGRFAQKMTLYPCRFPFRTSLGRGIQDTEITSGDLATASTLSGVREGTKIDERGQRESEENFWSTKDQILNKKMIE